MKKARHMTPMMYIDQNGNSATVMKTRAGLLDLIT